MYIDIQPEHDYVISYYTMYQLHVSTITGPSLVVLSLHNRRI